MVRGAERRMRLLAAAVPRSDGPEHGGRTSVGKSLAVKPVAPVVTTMAHGSPPIGRVPVGFALAMPPMFVGNWRILLRGH